MSFLNHKDLCHQTLLLMTIFFSHLITSVGLSFMGHYDQNVWSALIYFSDSTFYKVFHLVTLLRIQSNVALETDQNLQGTSNSSLCFIHEVISETIMITFNSSQGNVIFLKAATWIFHTIKLVSIFTFVLNFQCTTVPYTLSYQL